MTDNNKLVKQATPFTPSGCAPPSSPSPASGDTPIDMAALRRRIHYRAWHRGFIEADLILGNYASAKVPTMSEAELSEFESLLSHNDNVIYHAITAGGAPPSGVAARLIGKIREYHNIQPYDAQT